ncbi:hypothetical protein GGS21DRAFT_526036 [Xylaria nigripes]|nr:hypothetical protein GGS21DRAFT_526036 [Xylaria nigripes]
MAPVSIMPDIPTDSEPAAPSATPLFEAPECTTPSSSTSSTSSTDASTSTNSVTITDTKTTAIPTGDPPLNTRRCFLCLTDEPECDPSIDWVTPCNCSLEGHHECLLAWITDLEAQGKEFRCSVCKSAILVTERYDPVLWLNNLLTHGFSRWSPRILLGFLFAGVVVSSAAYGAKAIDLFGGPDAVMSYLTKTDSPDGTHDESEHPREDHRIHLFRYSTLPFIAPALVINRMNLGDVATLPISLVYVGVSYCHAMDFHTWPPGPDRVFLAFYPILKATYFNIHRTLSDSLERSWAARARAMTAEQGSQATHIVTSPPAPTVARNVLEFEIDLQIGGYGNDDDDDEPRNNEEPQRNRAANVGSQSPIDFIAGALLWPGVCYGMGELMRRLLPARFVTKPSNGPVTGLLQQRWGRSFVGGCLFVVLKDAFFLYVKYKKMMNYPHRRVKNSDKRNIRK